MTDPDFPDRPDHPDFWLLSRAILDLDGRADGGQPWADILGRYLDVDSILYMSRQRAARVATHLGKGPAVPRYQAAWIDGFALGMAAAALKAQEQDQETR